MHIRITSIAALILIATLDFAQADPTSYTFTFTPEQTDALYMALERASQAQALITGERSPRFDALEVQIRQGVVEQKAVKAPEAPKSP